MGRVVVITGGTSGIGLQLKESFVKNGDTVLTFSTRELDDPNHYSGSVGHEIKVRQVFNDIHEKYGKIDMLINCAGIGMCGITEHVSTENIMKLVEVNYLGTLYCIRSALQYMDVGARIVNLSSAMALFPVPFKSIYGSLKSAILNLSLSLRMELKPLGIDVVAICPGDTKTEFTKNRIIEPETSEKYGDLLKTSMQKAEQRDSKRMPCEEVSEKIYKLVNLKKTKPFYIIGGKYKFWYFLSRFAPKSALLNVIARKMGGKMTEDVKKTLKIQAKAEKEELKKQALAKKEQEKQQSLEQMSKGFEVEEVESITTETTEINEESSKVSEIEKVDDVKEVSEEQQNEESEQESDFSENEEMKDSEGVKGEAESTPASKAGTLSSLLSKMTNSHKDDE